MTKKQASSSRKRMQSRAGGGKSQTATVRGWPGLELNRAARRQDLHFLPRFVRTAVKRARARIIAEAREKVQAEKKVRGLDQVVFDEVA